MKAAIFTRVSDPRKQDAENQHRDLLGWAKQQGWEVVESYTIGESAWRGKDERYMAQVYKDARLGKFQILAVWSLDRLTRRGVTALIRILDTFHTHRVKVISLQESWTEIDGPFREMFTACVATFAKFESDRQSERVKAGMERVRAQGKVLGRPPGSKDGYKRKRRGYYARYA